MKGWLQDRWEDLQDLADTARRVLLAALFLLAFMTFAVGLLAG